MVDRAAEFWASPPGSLHPRTTVAEALNISVAKLERDTWLRQGLPIIRVGRQVRYRKADVVAYLEANTEHFSARNPDGG
jgi:excisionase family DNA binding protein